MDGATLKWGTKAASFDEYIAAYNRGDHRRALQFLLPLVDQGNARAQFYLGLAYYLGEGVPQNDPEAMKWCRLAADQGETGAQFTIGGLYERGEGVRQDYVEAFKWYSASPTFSTGRKKQVRSMAA